MTDTDGTLWKDDLLGYSGIAETFTHLIQSIDDTKVISIEAGFGQGKTFLRENWAKHLRALGEVVIEIDAQQSDHSGEPVITFLGALLAAMPRATKAKGQVVKEQGLKLAKAAGRVAVQVVARNAMEEVVDLAAGWVGGKAEGVKALEESVAELGEGMTKYGEQLIRTQLAAEHAREKELPQQIATIRDALTEGAAHKRVVVLIDELDRCHPDYAIAFLEAMKLVFNAEGFVFCLFVNADYLESLAQHRFGTKDAGERYLEKFVDIRLRLEATRAVKAAATRQLTKALPLAIPFGESDAFSVAHAAELAGKLVMQSNLSFRQIKRILDKVELALRCYQQCPVDCSLLVLLSFEAVINASEKLSEREQRDWLKNHLPRAALTPSQAANYVKELKMLGQSSEKIWAASERFVRENCSDLLGLPRDRYQFPAPADRGVDTGFVLVLAGLGPRYIPDHQAMLNAVHRLMV
ncbi:KAP family P-loop NTPase fold protein [Rhodobacter capsulatus]|uniref:KAP family P-loop NTPase fold protein n=1 Tax=Rhodobacter capsulatus TaxID=1061 RepID=UPI0003D35334|nr:P-loop NTPase fold protein [Rhodobacter capsulatus]ETD81827.1 hypothetical protein U703_14940 [Rhodobacter capsulatus YW1]